MIKVCQYQYTRCEYNFSTRLICLHTQTNLISKQNIWTYGTAREYLYTQKLEINCLGCHLTVSILDIRVKIKCSNKRCVFLKGNLYKDFIFLCFPE